VNFTSLWKFSIWVVSGTFTADSVKVLTTLLDSLTVTASTNVTFSGGTPSLTAGENFSDNISLALDGAHDYWIAVHGTSGATLKVNNVDVVPGYLFGTGYTSGDQTGVSTIPSSVTNEVVFSRVVTV
jgi:hypothetical protein